MMNIRNMFYFLIKLLFSFAVVIPVFALLHNKPIPQNMLANNDHNPLSRHICTQRNVHPMTVEFYTNPNYAGQKYVYQQGSIVDLWVSNKLLNDKFRSFCVGRNVTLYTFGGAYFHLGLKKYEGGSMEDNYPPHLTSFIILEQHKEPIRLQFASNNFQSGICFASKQPPFIKNSDCGQNESGDKTKDRIVGVIDKQTNQIIQVPFSLYTNREASANGMLLFKWDSRAKKVVLVSSVKPNNLSIEQDDDNRFLLRLNN